MIHSVLDLKVKIHFRSVPQCKEAIKIRLGREHFYREAKGQVRGDDFVCCGRQNLKERGWKFAERGVWQGIHRSTTSIHNAFKRRGGEKRNSQMADKIRRRMSIWNLLRTNVNPIIFLFGCHGGEDRTETVTNSRGVWPHSHCWRRKQHCDQPPNKNNKIRQEKEEKMGCWEIAL